MRKLFRNTLIASAVIAAGIAAGANNAMAVDSSPIEFTYGSPNTCTFGTPTKGTLTAGTAGSNARLTSSGTGATISLNCNAGATIEVKELQETQTNGMTRPTATGAGWYNVLVSSPSGGTAYLYESGTKSAPITKTTAFSETLNVGMDLRFNQATLAPGGYIYKTVLTATPN